MRVDEILDLDEAKAYLNIRTSTTDEELEGFIPAAIGRVERHLDQALVDVQVTETVAAWDGVVILSHRPVREIVSATIPGALAPTWPTGSTVVDPTLPAIVNTDSAFGGPVEVTYKVGRTSVTANEKLAVKMVLAEYWRTQRVEVSRAAGISYASGVALESDAGPAGTAPMRLRLQEILGPAAAPRP